MKIKSGLLKFAAATGLVLGMATVPALAAQTYGSGEGTLNLPG